MLQRLSTPKNDLASCLALLDEQRELKAVIEAWPDLPEAIRVGILAIINVVKRASSPCGMAPHAIALDELTQW
jgi:hypothetical protein